MGMVPTALSLSLSPSLSLCTHMIKQCNLFSVMQCSAVPEVANGVASSTSNNYKDVVTFTCKEGFFLSGAQTLTCTERGWDSPAPTCPRK